MFHHFGVRSGGQCDAHVVSIAEEFLWVRLRVSPQPYDWVTPFSHCAMHEQSHINTIGLEHRHLWTRPRHDQ